MEEKLNKILKQSTRIRKFAWEEGSKMFGCFGFIIAVLLSIVFFINEGIDVPPIFPILLNAFIIWICFCYLFCWINIFIGLYLRSKKKRGKE